MNLLLHWKCIYSYIFLCLCHEYKKKSNLLTSVFFMNVQGKGRMVIVTQTYYRL